jgi:hypothetical protein
MGADDREAIETELEQSWTGQEFLWEIRQEEMREIIREHIAAEKVPHRQRLAREIGLSVHRLRLFLDGAPLHPHESDRVAPWFADKAKPNPRVSPYAVCLGVLCEWFPARLAYEARRNLAIYVRRIYESRRIEMPERARRELESLIQSPALPKREVRARAKP